MKGLGSTRKVQRYKGVLYVSIPREVREFLQIEKGDLIEVIFVKKIKRY